MARGAESSFGRNALRPFRSIKGDKRMAFPSLSRKRLARGLSWRPRPPVPGKRELRLEELEPRNLLSVLNLEFGTASSPLAAGYTKVTESTMYGAPQGFGWLTYGVTSRD